MEKTCRRTGQEGSPDGGQSNSQRERETKESYRGQTISRDLEVNRTSFDLILGRTLWHRLIHVVDPTQWKKVCYNMLLFLPCPSSTLNQTVVYFIIMLYLVNLYSKGIWCSSFLALFSCRLYNIHIFNDHLVFWCTSSRDASFVLLHN